jgi:hypothetical protein
VTSYLRRGWLEFLVPVRPELGAGQLVVWIDAEDTLPMLRRLDAAYGDDEHPYCLDPRQIPEANRDLTWMVAEHVIAHPESVKRVSASRRLAAELAERFGVGPSGYPLPYPPAIDLVDLDPMQMAMVMPLILGRREQGDG